ncbi:MAG: DUF2147 domain-containing protein [Geobacter sp.]|nr:DUF2147 domain-containing protein [Geobacter sp.]
MTMVRLPGICLMVLLLAGAAHAAGGDAITGLWEVAEGDGRIEIYRCAAKYCGRIAWLKEPLYPPGDKGGMAGKPLVDRDNPQKELASRPQLGLQIMAGYTFRGDGFWDEGTIYNTENGKSYSSNIRLKSPDRLELRGYIGIPLLGGSTVWKRVK